MVIKEIIQKKIIFITQWTLQEWLTNGQPYYKIDNQSIKLNKYKKRKKRYNNKKNIGPNQRQLVYKRKDNEKKKNNMKEIKHKKNWSINKRSQMNLIEGKRKKNKTLEITYKCPIKHQLININRLQNQRS